MTNIIEWPSSLGIRDMRFTVEDPTAWSSSIFTGARSGTAHARRRTLVDLDVSIQRNSGYGIQEGLISLLEGNRNLVRLRMAMPNKITSPRTQGLSWDTTWDITWEYAEGLPLDRSGVPVVRVQNLVANKKCAEAGEFVIMNGQSRRLLQDLDANAQGIAVAVVDEAFAASVDYQPIELGAKCNVVLEMADRRMPEVVKPFAREGDVTWRMRQVYDIEIDNAVEVKVWD